MPVFPDSFHLPLGAILPDRPSREPSCLRFGFTDDKKGLAAVAPQELGAQP